MRRFSRQLGRVVTRVEEVCLAGGVLGIAALTIANVLGRTLFGHSLAFADELCRFLIVVVTFLGIGYAASRRRHIRMTALYDQLPERARAGLDKVISATTCALLLGLTVLGLRYSLGTLRSLGSVSPVLEVPLWIVALSAPLGFLLGAVQYGLDVVGAGPPREEAEAPEVGL